MGIMTTSEIQAQAAFHDHEDLVRIVFEMRAKLAALDWIAKSTAGDGGGVGVGAVEIVYGVVEPSGLSVATGIPTARTNGFGDVEIYDKRTSPATATGEIVRCYTGSTAGCPAGAWISMRVWKDDDTKYDIVCEFC